MAVIGHLAQALFSYFMSSFERAILIFRYLFLHALSLSFSLAGWLILIHSLAALCYIFYSFQMHKFTKRNILHMHFHSDGCTYNERPN